jgi:predicted enzyme related to lactoylglutathione lyase
LRRHDSTAVTIKELNQMHVNEFVVAVNSENPERLIAFYRDTVGLTVEQAMGPGAFVVGSAPGVSLIIEGHSEVASATTEPNRIMLNFFVDDLRAEQARLEEAGVPFLVKAQAWPGFGLVSTFHDPDGNTCQLMELRDDL